jgi:hypothetical protein
MVNKRFLASTFNQQVTAFQCLLQRDLACGRTAKRSAGDNSF